MTAVQATPTDHDAVPPCPAWCDHDDDDRDNAGRLAVRYHASAPMLIQHGGADDFDTTPHTVEIELRQSWQSGPVGWTPKFLAVSLDNTDEHYLRKDVATAVRDALSLLIDRLDD